MIELTVVLIALCTKGVFCGPRYSAGPYTPAVRSDAAAPTSLMHPGLSRGELPQLTETDAQEVLAALQADEGQAFELAALRSQRIRYTARRLPCGAIEMAVHTLKGDQWVLEPVSEIRGRDVTPRTFPLLFDHQRDWAKIHMVRQQPAAWVVLNLQGSPMAYAHDAFQAARLLVALENDGPESLYLEPGEVLEAGPTDAEMEQWRKEELYEDMRLRGWL